MSSGIRHQILESIRKNRRITATELSESLVLHKSTISQNLKELALHSVVREAGPVDGVHRVGKPRVNLELNPGYCHVIGIDASPTHLRGAIYDFQGRQTSFREVEYTALRQPEPFLSDLHGFVDRLVSDSRGLESPCLGLGVGFSGIIDSQRGFIHLSESIGLKNYPLAEDLEKRYKLPVRILNDANAALLGEKWYILDQETGNEENILYCFMDSNFVSVGFGLMIGGQIYEGSSFQAGEVYSYMHEQAVYQNLSRLVEPLGIVIPPWERNFREYFSPAAVAVGADKVVLKKLFEIYTNLLIFVCQLLNPGLLVMGGNFAFHRKVFLDPFLEYFKEEFRTRFPDQVMLPVVASGMELAPVCAGVTVPFFRELLASF